MIIDQIIDAQYEHGDDPHIIATFVLTTVDDLPSSERQAAFLELILEATRCRLRELVRRKEQEASRRSRIPRSRLPRKDGKKVLSTRNSWFLDEKIFVPGRDVITWGEATAEDLQLRMDYLRKQLGSHVASEEATIDFAARTREFILRTKVKCLNEYPDFQVEMIPAVLSEAVNA